MFLTKVMTRTDARASFWKERFLYGLPRAFNEKVQESLRERNNGTIPYDELTYGDIISEVKKEGLKLCSQLKLQYQVKKDLKASKKDLGSFCAQYGISMPTPPSQSFIKRKNLIKNLKNSSLKNQMNKNLIKKKLDVLSVVKRVI